MKLKQIPNNTVVHTPTEAEAKELLAILHENGYTYCDGESLLDNDWLIDLYNKNNELESLCIEPYAKITKHIEHCNIGWFRKQGYTILTLAGFKAKYCEEEKPQPKFKVGDRVRIIQDGTVNPDYLGTVDEIVSIGLSIRLKNTDSNWFETSLEPYTEPETKEDVMELKSETLTDDCKSSVKVEKRLNLCELLKGHEREIFYHLMYGEVRYKGIDEDGFIAFTDSEIPIIYDDGKYDQDANVVLFPSRALYEQYPLDPYTAWMKWQEEQKVDIIKYLSDDLAERMTVKLKRIYSNLSEGLNYCHEDCVCEALDSLEELFGEEFFQH